MFDTLNFVQRYKIWQINPTLRLKTRYRESIMEIINFLEKVPANDNIGIFFILLLKQQPLFILATMERLIYTIACLSCITICLTMGIVLLSIRTHNLLYNEKYTISKRFLAVAYFIVAIGYSVIFYREAIWEYVPASELFPFIVFFISSLQALLFTYSLICLFRSEYASWKNAIKTLLSILAFCAVYFISVAVFGNPRLHSFTLLKQYILHPTVLIRIAFFLFYIGLLVRFSIIFFRERALFLEKIEDYYSNTEKVLLRWANIAYASAIIIGILILTIYAVPNRLYGSVITFIIGGFYLSFAIQYVNYQNFDPLIYHATENSTSVQKSEKADDAWLEERISEWKSLDKPYLKQGITIEDIASELNVNRKILSSYINSVYKCNFNYWINGMRIEETIHILDEEPGKSIAEVSEIVGFGDKSILCRQFKKHVGKTITSWRNQRKK